MPYEPLHHKYRPKSFAELVGQEAIATTLTNAIRTSKIAPAYLFTGPRGTGKTSSARILAKSLNCLNSDKPTPEPCGTCDVCQGINKGSTLDVIEIDAASNTGVDNIREIIERAQFAPVQCRYKVYVVDECHMLSTAAFNALLKTLEEPPKHVVFVLATTDPQRVLPTIISRCQRFDFRRIALDRMIMHLSKIAAAESININTEAIALISQFAQGGLRDAQSLLDQLSLLSGEVTPERVWDLVGSVSERDLMGLLQAIASNDPEAILDFTREILDRGREPLIILQNLASFYRDLLIAKTASKRNDLVTCTQEVWQELIEEAKKFDLNTILLGQQHLRSAEVQLKNTTQPRLWLEITLLGLLPTVSNLSYQQQITPQQIVSAPTKIHQNQAAPARPLSSSSPLSSTESRHTPSELKTTNNGIQGQIPTVATSASSPTSAPGNSPISSPETRRTGTEVNVNGVQKQTPTTPISEIITASSPIPSQTSAASLENMWHQVLQTLPIPAQALLKQHGRLLTVNDVSATVGVPPKLVKLARSKSADVENAFGKVCQRKIKVNFQPNQPQNKTGGEASVSSPGQPSPSPAQSPVPSFNHQTTPSTASSFTYTQTSKQPTARTHPTQNQPPIAKPNLEAAPPPQHQQNKPSKPIESDPEAEQVMSSAKRLAQFFDGAIVSFVDEPAEFDDSSNVLEMEEDDF
ncbi:DNA polymerase III subunit gamma/tau [Mastigocoleus testarum]|uniref:DNA polymerase III subunit gamma/tau n=1 Tax=Mastigocoleus testarum BC008 TaxID=371196 RepID=A0A0V7ZSI4_9CYAN|nr:DNA polymerase III subunit gamma/tau [Mastigocoleus testarum]KST67434.1 DNA polymerase III subunit gamma/tau [Mastigocoleus testarum BC008]